MYDFSFYISVPSVIAKEIEVIDYNKICQGIAKAETSGGTRGSALSKKNAHGIMVWSKKGKRSLKVFDSLEASHNACVKLWEKSYKVVPTIKEAERWTGSDNARRWLNNVLYVYHKK